MTRGVKTRHRCWAQGCTELVERRLLMCVTHWKLVPKPLADRVWKTYAQKHRGGAYEAAHRNACIDAKRAVDAKLAQTTLSFGDAPV